MQWLEEMVRPEIRALAPYRSARATVTRGGVEIQLDANENPFLPYPGSASCDLNRYPEPQPEALRRVLAMLYGVTPSQLLVTRGMDEGIDLLIRTFCRPNQDAIKIVPPTFGFYEVAANIAGVAVKRANSLGSIKLENNENVKIIFLCSPNNPTGEIISSETISELCALFQYKALIAVDEAYVEFSELESSTKLLEKYENLVVMRTLSKAYGLAGARIGSVMGGESIINYLKKIIAPYPLPTPSIQAALSALSPIGQQQAKRAIAIIKNERTRVAEALKKISDIEKIYPCNGNFILVKVKDAQCFCSALLKQGILVRDRSQDILNTVRISIGTVSENNLLLQALGIQSEAFQLSRESWRVRKTKETEVSVRIYLDSNKNVRIQTGIGFFDHMLEQLAVHGQIGMEIDAVGDVEIDLHHTIEDVAIVLGQALKSALGSKVGINRYGFLLPMDEALAQVALDLSGRGVFRFEGQFPCATLGEFPTEMVEHFFMSLSMNLGAALHMKVLGENAHHMVESCFKAFGKVLRQAVSESGEAMPSTKGIL